MELASAKLVSNNGPSKVVCELKDTVNGHVHTAEFEHCLYSIGRIPNTKDLDLDKAGVKIGSRGGIETESNARTSAPHIFACGMHFLFLFDSYNLLNSIGDSTADIGLVNVGEMEARHAVEAICLG